MNSLIGNTPMIKIQYKYNNKINEIYVKLEYYNLTGSIKDRLAHYIVTEETKNGNLKEGQAIIEATSGNTGISLSAIGTLTKHPVYIFMPDWVSQERVNLMKMFNAQVTLVSKEEGGFQKCISLAKSLAQQIDGFLPNQFSNKLNIKCHMDTTGEEIVEQLSNQNIGGFVSGIGTGGTLMGVSRKLKENYPNIITCAVEPKQMSLLTTGNIIRNHKIEGIGDDFIPEIVNTEEIDCVFDIDDDDAINMARILSRKLGLGVGISSGTNLIGSILLQDKININVVTIFPDDNKKYLSTSLIDDISLDTTLISNKIELLEYSLLR